MAAHRFQRNNQERGRYQQLGNDDRKKCTEDDHEGRQSQIVEMNPVQMASHRSQRNIQERGRSQQLKDLLKMKQFELHLSTSL